MLNNSLGNWFMLNELFLVSLPLFPNKVFKSEIRGSILL
jgi:hypothetical protein